MPDTTANCVGMRPGMWISFSRVNVPELFWFTTMNALSADSRTAAGSTGCAKVTVVVCFTVGMATPLVVLM